jgi:hypothetical protein
MSILSSYHRVGRQRCTPCHPAKGQDARQRSCSRRWYYCTMCGCRRCQFLRTGSASENIPPRMRNCKYKGMDSFPIYWQISKIKSLPPRTADLNLAKEMQAAVRKLERKFGMS